LVLRNTCFSFSAFYWRKKFPDRFKKQSFGILYSLKNGRGKKAKGISVIEKFLEENEIKHIVAS